MTPSSSPHKPLDLDAADRLLRAYMQAAMPPVWPAPPETSMPKTMPPSAVALATPHSLIQREQSSIWEQYRPTLRNARHILALSLAGLLGLGWWICQQYPLHTTPGNTPSSSTGSILPNLEASNPEALKQLQKSENIKNPPPPKRLELP